jgi:hypothetical protein
MRNILAHNIAQVVARALDSALSGASPTRAREERQVMPQPVTYLFKSPIKHQDELIYDIQVRPPVMRDLKALNGIVGTFTRAGKMIELLTGLTAREVDEISLEDIRGLGEIVRPFFINWQPAATSQAR